LPVRAVPPEGGAKVDAHPENVERCSTTSYAYWEPSIGAEKKPR
jgi:hypothetical protein